MNVEPPLPTQKPAWIRDQILANAKILFHIHGPVEVITAKESLNIPHYSGSGQYMCTAYIVSVKSMAADMKDNDSDESIGMDQVEGERDALRAFPGILLYGNSIVGTTEDALGGLLAKTEELMKDLYERWKTQCMRQMLSPGLR